jgi:hypothetical protein
MPLAAWLVAMVGPVMARWLASVGLSLVSVAGLTVAYQALKAQVISGIGGLSAAAIQLGGLLGIWEALGIFMGALVFVMTWRGTSGMWKLAKT